VPMPGQVSLDQLKVMGAIERCRLKAVSKADLNYQLRSTLSFLVKPHFLHASESSSNAPPNRIGLIRVIAISVPHRGHVDEAFSGGNSWPAT